VHMGTSDPIFLKKIENKFSYFQKILITNEDVANDVYHKRSNYQTGNNVYFKLHRNKKSVDLSITFSNLQNIPDFYCFLWPII
jgi:hypothetical protein